MAQNNCWRLLVAVVTIVFLLPYPCLSDIDPTFAPTATKAPSGVDHLCRPEYTVTKFQCEKRIVRCLAEDIYMKWTGTGCVFDGVRANDGGCQCDGYCGYQCETACNHDKQCYWYTKENACYQKAHGTVGVPIDPCPKAHY